MKTGRAALLVAFVASALAGGLTGQASAQYPLPAPPQGTPPPLIQPPQLLSPFPIVRIVGSLNRGGARIRLLTVRAPARALILVSCYRRGCRRRSLREGRGINRAVRFRRFELNLRAGTVIEVRINRSGGIGKFTRFRIRRGRRPARRDMCLLPGETRGTVCPEP